VAVGVVVGESSAAEIRKISKLHVYRYVPPVAGVNTVPLMVRFLLERGSVSNHGRKHVLYTSQFDQLLTKLSHFVKITVSLGQFTVLISYPSARSRTRSMVK